MVAEPTDSSVSYQLEHGYKMTKITGSECILLLRDKKDNVVAIVDACFNKISKIRGYKNAPITTIIKEVLRGFIKSKHYDLSAEAAKDLDLSIFRQGDNPELYLNEEELHRKLKSRLVDASITIHKLRQNTLKISAFSEGAVLNFTHAEVKHLVIEKHCNLILDLRDNQSIKSLHVKESFTGNMNLSRNSIEDIRMDNNCRCDMTVCSSLKCFNMEIADVFSGNLDIRNSCFHRLKVGYYCYAVIKLNGNWGRKDITIGDSFRGTLSVDTVHVPDLLIGNDCKGKIVISSSNSERGSRHVNLADDFKGVLDVSGSQTVERIDVGRNACGRLHLKGCPAVKITKFDEDFSGFADFSESAIEYVRAHKGCRGELVFKNCDNLALLKLPVDKRSKLMIEKQPLNTEIAGEHIYYRFHPQELPDFYFASAYCKWFGGLKKILSFSKNT